MKRIFAFRVYDEKRYSTNASKKQVDPDIYSEAEECSPYKARAVFRIVTPKK
jgi:hypothetical protein